MIDQFGSLISAVSKMSESFAAPASKPTELSINGSKIVRAVEENVSQESDRRIRMAQ